MFRVCSALSKRGATEALCTLSTSRHSSNTTPSAPCPTAFITGVNWQLSEMGTASHMSVVVSGNGGMRHGNAPACSPVPFYGPFALYGSRSIRAVQPSVSAHFQPSSLRHKLYRIQEGRPYKQHSSTQEVAQGLCATAARVFLFRKRCYYCCILWLWNYETEILPVHHNAVEVCTTSV